MATKVLAATYAGVGGPKDAKMAADGFMAGPTDPGRYRVAYYGRHSSIRYPGFSTFLWGSDVKEEGGKVFVLHRGAWTNVERYGLNRAQIVEYCEFLYGIAKVPKKWVFNSFGHLTCYLYRDLNNNARMDGKEKIHGELIHTTPENEAEDWLGMQVELGDSHGCIHVKPADIDDMINRRFLKKGALVVVHRYEEAHPVRKAKDQPLRAL